MSKKTKNITIKMFRKYHTEVGEDFCDQNEHIINHMVLGGFLMAKNPELSPEILDVLNKFGSDTQELSEIYMFKFPYKDHGDVFYKLLVEFINLTVTTKEKVYNILKKYK